METTASQGKWKWSEENKYIKNIYNVIQGIIIGNNTVIGAGSTVVKNIGNFKKAYGNPCREIEGIK